jgi:hypothetical protein
MFICRASASVTRQLTVNADCVTACTSDGTQTYLSFIQQAVVEVLLAFDTDRIFLKTKISA